MLSRSVAPEDTPTRNNYLSKTANFGAGNLLNNNETSLVSQKTTPRSRSGCKEAPTNNCTPSTTANKTSTDNKMSPTKKASNNMGSHYVIGCKLGSGSFGTIYHCRNENKKKDYAIKMESCDDADGSSQLAQEAKILLLLENHVGFCKFAYCDFEYSHFPDKNLLVMDLLGPTIEDLMNLCNRNFTLKTICLFAEQALNRIEVLHSKNYIHRDIKPENFLIGSSRSNQRTIYLADFGLCKKYRDPKTLVHIPYRDGRSLSGTARYASINAQSGIEQSRRDDLEGLFYTVIYLYRGELPWQGIQAPNKAEKHKRMLKQKKTMTINELCMNCPPEFHKYIQYVRKLKFEEAPDYEFLRNLFRNMLKTWFSKETMKTFVEVSSQETKLVSGGNNKNVFGTSTPADNSDESRKPWDDDDDTYRGDRGEKLSLADQLRRGPSSTSTASTVSGNGMVNHAFDRDSSFHKIRENLKDPIFDWEKQRGFYPKMKCTGMPELSEDADSQRDRAKGLATPRTSNTPASGNRNNTSNIRSTGNNVDHWAARDNNRDRSPSGKTPGNYSSNYGVPAYASGYRNSYANGDYDNNNDYSGQPAKASDVSNPRTFPGNQVCVEKVVNTNSRQRVTPRQSSGNFAEMSRNSTAKFGRDDSRIAGNEKKGGPLTRFIGFCNKKNPPQNTYTPR